MMNSRLKISFAWMIVWTIIGFAVSSNGRPSDENDSGLTDLSMSRSIDEDKEPDDQTDQITVANDEKIEAAASVVVPQVGYLEERPDVSKIGKDPLPVVVSSPNGFDSGSEKVNEETGNGILVPIVSVVDGDSSKSNAGIVNHPLVALLPAPTDDNQNSKLPEISTLSVIQAEAKPEIRRSIDVDSHNNEEDDKNSEIMDVAEDIVFRPLFAVRQSAGKSPYTSRNFRRNYRPNYQRYNVNGYYKIPNNYYYRSNNNRVRNDYSNEYDKRSV